MIAIIFGAPDTTRERKGLSSFHDLPPLLFPHFYYCYQGPKRTPTAIATMTPTTAYTLKPLDLLRPRARSNFLPLDST